MLFSDVSIVELSSGEGEMLRGVAPSHDVKENTLLMDVLVDAQLASSKREARQFLGEKAVSLNGEVVTDEKRKLAAGDFPSGFALLKRGKRNVCVLILSN